MNPLDRLPNETTPAYAAFVVYVRLGPNRSAAAAAKQVGKSETLLERWSARHNWLRRAQAWDVLEAKRQGEAEDKAKDAAAVSVAAQRLKVQESAWAWFEKLKAKAEEMLAFPVFQRTIRDRHPDGQEKVTIVEPLNWRFGDVAKIIETADALGRLAAGMPQKVTAISDPEGKPFTFPRNGEAPPPVIIYFTDNENTRSAVAQFGPRPTRGNGEAPGGPVDGP
jgi:hypothetical protein